MKTFIDVVKGDYIFYRYEVYPDEYDYEYDEDEHNDGIKTIPYKVLDIKVDENENYDFLVKKFGENEEDTIMISFTKEEVVKNKLEHWYQHDEYTEWNTYGYNNDEENDDVPHMYIHNKTGKEYTCIKENLLVKENGTTWNNGYVLYKAEYDNPDGPYFVRIADDFYSNFTKIL